MKKITEISKKLEIVIPFFCLLAFGLCISVENYFAAYAWFFAAYASFVAYIRQS